MNRLVFGVGITIAATVSSFIWPLLSAKLWIPVKLEIFLYLLSLAVVLCGALIISYSGTSKAGKYFLAMLTAILVGGASVCLMYGAWRQSNDLFLYWAMRVTPKTDWPEIANQMNALATESLQGNPDDYAQIIARNLPDKFGKVIGRASEYAYGLVQKDKDGVIVVGLAYGYKARRWGLFRGELMRDKWPRAKTRRVYGDVYYFVTTDY